MKRKSKQDCIITQSTTPSRLMSVARNTKSSPWLNGAVWYSSFSETKDITVPDILLEIDTGTEVTGSLPEMIHVARDHSWCLIPPRLECFLPCWGGCIDWSRDGLACLCGRGRSWCLSPPPFPRPARQQSRQEESPQSCESTISLSWWVTHSHTPSLSNIIHKKYN